MHFLAKAAILAGLIQILVITRKPIICATIYAVIYFLIALLLAGDFADFLLSATFGTAFAFGLSYGYYWLLNRLYDSSLGLFWGAIFLGLFIGIV
ncbi:hypothetical protein V6Z05_19800 [Leptospira venezuelensis]|uniref:hypothetical protein n=1 Tax=Leptospira venezuelensis TaxID=1958811 RepID=UPI000A3BA3F5|nr:hypothetical protein [Leptospira venezuelensis]